MDTVILLHGTTEANAAAIRAGGFAPSNPKRAARIVEEHFGLPEGSIYNHEYYAFPRHRRDLDRVHFTTLPSTAEHYSVPEQYQDALATAYRIMFPPAEDENGRDYAARERPWRAQHAAAIAGAGVVLKVELPLSVIGANAFGRVWTRTEFDKYGMPETLSLPVEVLALAKVA